MQCDTVRQRSAQSTADWRLDDESLPGAWSWRIVEHQLEPEKARETTPRRDIALAVGASRTVLPAVQAYVRDHLPTVGRIVELLPPEGPDATSVLNGHHAGKLAGQLSAAIESLAPAHGEEVFHLFYSGPNGLLFFLGQRRDAPWCIQLYEFDFDGEGNRTYTPSLRFRERS